MVKSFHFTGLPAIYFGKGNISGLPDIVRTFGNSIILLTGSQSFCNSLFAGNLFQRFKEKGITHHRLIVSGEPSPQIIDDAVKRFNKENIKLVVSIGGGSVIDAGKALSAMMYSKETIKDFLEGVGTKEHPGSKLPFIAVPTTAGTGSEATKNAVLSETGRNGFKRSLRHEKFVPDIAVVDPELTLNCPREITAASGMDCFTQLIEAYLSDKSGEYTDALAEKGLMAIKTSLVKSYTNGGDVEARTGMSFAALTSGICLANAGLGVVHGFASSIGGMHVIPHGVICGTLMAKSNEIIVRELRRKATNPAALKKYALLGRLFLDKPDETDDYYIDGFISYLNALTEELQLPGLKKYGLKEENLEMICAKTEIKNNPVILPPEDLLEIVSDRLF